MTPAEFCHLLQIGLGRAVLYARQHDVSAFREVILDACLHCYSIDPQFEGTRSVYMLDVLATLPDREFYCAEIVKSLCECGDDWDTDQRFSLAASLAREGDEQARLAMYANFNPGPLRGDSIGANFVQMDGIAGLVFAAEKIGLLMRATQSPVDAGWLLDQSDELFGEQPSLDALREAARTSLGVETYLSFVADSRRRSGERRPRRPSSYQELVEMPDASCCMGHVGRACERCRIGAGGARTPRCGRHRGSDSAP